MMPYFVTELIQDVYFHSYRLPQFSDKVAKSVEDELQRISLCPEYSPVLLAWMLLNYIESDQGRKRQSPSQAERLAEKAVEQRVLEVIEAIARDVVIHVSDSFYGVTRLKIIRNVFVLIIQWEIKIVSSI